MTQLRSNGVINVGGLLIPRADLEELLPDLPRFERHLHHAIEADQHAAEQLGRLPDFMESLDDRTWADVFATLREVSMLRGLAA